MTILNFTPHVLNFFNSNDVVFDASIRKNVAKDGATPFLTIPSSGMLSAKIDTVDGDPVAGIPTFIKKVTGCDPLPAVDSPVVVSALYAVAAQKSGLDMSRVFTVADPVFSADGRTVLGCLGICPAI